MNATLYDPADVAFSSGPLLLCAACQRKEVGIYDSVCPASAASRWSRPES